MAYTRQTWADDDATKPLSAARMTTIEFGIESAANTADGAASVANTAQNTANAASSTANTASNTATSASNAAATAQNAADAAATAAATANTDAVKARPGVGTLVIVREGIDTSTGAANEIILTASGGGGTSSSAPPGLDVEGGLIGASLSDPSQIDYPADTTEGEGLGRVYAITNGQRGAVRVNIYSDRIDRVSWWVLEGSTVSLPGQVAICHPTSGAILASANINVTTSTITATTGNVNSWNLATPLTNLNLAQVVFAWQITAAGTLRTFGKGQSGLFQPTALRAGGSLHRSGAYTPGASMSGSIDLSATANWTKRPVPNIVMLRTS